MSTTNTDPTRMSDEEIRVAVRDRYAASALAVTVDQGEQGGGCACGCGPTGGDAITSDLYPPEAADTSPGALAASLGCGNPTALADLQAGQVVLDLGSGGGLDVLLAARRVGPTGRAYGLDMTPEMLDLARRNQAEAGISNAEFLAGRIEHIPLPAASVDVVISNCVINLAADKDAVLREASRVLRAGGRLAVSDIVLLRPLPDVANRAMRLWTGCVSGALLADDYRARLAAVGFTDVTVQVTRTLSATDLADLARDLPADALPADVDPAAVTADMDGAVASAFIRAVKP